MSDERLKERLTGSQLRSSEWRPVARPRRGLPTARERSSMRDHIRLVRACSLCFVFIVVVGCTRKVRDYPTPASALSVDHLRYVVLKKGDGRFAMDGGIWGVESGLVSYTERGSVAMKVGPGLRSSE